MNTTIEKLRQEYGDTPLLERDLSPNPLKMFERWLKEAIRAKVFEPNGMTLATASASGRCSARTVLLKGIESRGFVFYSHYESRKGEQLGESAQASLVFWWRELYRQVSVEGEVKKLSRSESKAYFAKRPRGARIAALASHQSEPLASREELEEAFARLEKKYRGKEIPCPATWGGYVLIPDRLEFWQGRKNRLHDRFVYVRQNADWLLTRLAP